MRIDKPIIGLAGGIGSGKSTVADLFSDLGAGVISSDRLNHEELNTPEVLRQMQQWWGPRIVRPDGQADREAIRSIVRQDTQAREKLEHLVHPRIAERRKVLMAAHASDETIKAIVWDSPLLFEAHLDGQCHRIIFVDCDLEVRVARVVRERNWTREELVRFEKLQKPLDFKKRRADYIIDTNSDRGCVHRQVEEVFSRILSGESRYNFR